MNEKLREHIEELFKNAPQNPPGGGNKGGNTAKHH